MSKRKTKKEKIIAEYRRKQRILEARKKRERALSRTSSKKKEKKKGRKRSTNASVSKDISSYERKELEQNTQRIVKDLKRTVVLSIIGVGVIFSLYFFALV